ncbi:anhydro-N-acetylmuramic acid kinase [bacterium]|nr:anhydro-N-acetylmuramic acid kinase [bacterium]
MLNKQKYTGVGVMSGTSLDGLDLALCHFFHTSETWTFEIEKYTTIAYTKEWQSRLANAQLLSAYDIVKLNREYGKLIGEEVRKFIVDIDQIDFVASHGHTVLHEPENNISLQVGDGAAIASLCGIQTISDFRTLDINLGGQGAPLVPIGDHLLFSEYDGCVNIGGFANISFDGEESRIAFDICPVNIVINDWVRKYYQIDFDKGGQLGAKGKPIPELLKSLNSLVFYKETGPKSLGREWVETIIDPIINNFIQHDKLDVLSTLYHHFAYQVAEQLNVNHLNKILFSGGGVYNEYLMKLIREKSNGEIIVPDDDVIECKEALIFAFLGLLRKLKINNCLCSVTGARKDNCGGVIHEV